MNYLRYQKIACKQIKEYGQLVTFRLSDGEEEYDPISGQVTKEITEVDVYAVLLSPEDKAVHSGTVKMSDAMLLVGGGTVPMDPDERSTVLLEGQEWRVLSVEKVAPSGLVIIYKVFIRKA